MLWTITVAALGLLASAIGAWAVYANNDIRALRDKSERHEAAISQHDADHKLIEYKLDLLLQKHGIDANAKK